MVSIFYLQEMSVFPHMWNFSYKHRKVRFYENDSILKYFKIVLNISFYGGKS